MQLHPPKALQRSVSMLPLALFLGFMAGCGSSTHKPKSQDSASESASLAASSETPNDGAEKEASAANEAIPTTCRRGSDPCLPQADFVKKLCSGSFPGAALYMFSKSPPFTKGYLTRRTEAWNASGGVSDTGFVEFDEEVLVLHARKADMGGMQVSGAGGGWDALRWSGTCVTLDEQELTFSKPPAAKSAKVEFRFLDEPIKEALRQDSAVDSAYMERRNECKGATSGDVSLKCVKADEALSRAIVEYVRKGGTVPLPEKLP